MVNDTVKINYTLSIKLFKACVARLGFHVLCLWNKCLEGSNIFHNPK